MLNVIFLAEVADSPLFIFEETFLVGSCVNVSVFEGALIRSPSCVCGWYDILKSLREVVHLEREVAHAVHLILLLRVRILGPD